jgi:hypothetical protein
MLSLWKLITKKRKTGETSNIFLNNCTTRSAEVVSVRQQIHTRFLVRPVNHGKPVNHALSLSFYTCNNSLFSHKLKILVLIGKEIQQVHYLSLYSYLFIFIFVSLLYLLYLLFPIFFLLLFSYSYILLVSLCPGPAVFF